jgi:hypothetical protein
MYAIALREYESLMVELDACMKTPTMEKQTHSLLVVPPPPFHLSQLVVVDSCRLGLGLYS